MADIRHRATLDTTGFNSGIGSMVSRTSAIGASLNSVLARIGIGFSLAGFVGWLKRAAEESDRLVDSAENLGVSLKEYQALSKVIARAGGDEGKMAAMLNKVTAAKPDKLAALGVTSTTGAIDTLQQIAQRGKDAGWSVDFLGKAFELLGTRNAYLAEGVLRSLADRSIPAVADEMERLGQIIEDTDALQLNALQDQLDDMGMSLDRLGAKAAANIGTTAAAIAATVNEVRQQSAGDIFKGWILPPGVKGSFFNQFLDQVQAIQAAANKRAEELRDQREARQKARAAERNAPKPERAEREPTFRAYDFGRDAGIRAGAVIGGVMSSGMQSSINQQYRKLQQIEANTKRTADAMTEPDAGEDVDA